MRGPRKRQLSRSGSKYGLEVSVKAFAGERSLVANLTRYHSGTLHISSCAGTVKKRPERGDRLYGPRSRLKDGWYRIQSSVGRVLEVRPMCGSLARPAPAEYDCAFLAARAGCADAATHVRVLGARQLQPEQAWHLT